MYMTVCHVNGTDTIQACLGYKYNMNLNDTTGICHNSYINHVSLNCFSCINSTKYQTDYRDVLPDFILYLCTHGCKIHLNSNTEIQALTQVTGKFCP